MKRALFVTYFLLASAACAGDDGDKPFEPPVDPDPLEVTTTPQAGSLDELHTKILAKRCSGQPGLCHNGQFEPNLSTPGLTYAYLVNRPGIEKPTLLRVKPGVSAQSLFIDKIRNRNGVATQMPLGAEPLVEEDIAALEKWINDGALRAPGAAPAQVGDPCAQQAQDDDAEDREVRVVVQPRLAERADVDAEEVRRVDGGVRPGPQVGELLVLEVERLQGHGRCECHDCELHATDA